MKYTIEGLSQEKLVSLGLDIADALILRWFLSFSGSGSMKKTVLKGKTFYLVMYKGIINDLPVLGITSTKAIGNRFDRYVEKGLLQKTILRQGSGTSLYFAPTKLLINLEYNQNTFQNELNYIGPPKEKNYEDNQGYLNFNENTEIVKQEEKEVFSYEEKSTSFHTENIFLKGTELPFREKNEQKSTEIVKKTFKNQENTQNLPEKTDVLTHEEKSTSFHTENISLKGTELPFRQEPDFLSERKFDSCALNNSLTKNSNTTTNSLTEEVAVIIKNEFSKKINPEIFSKDFWDKLIFAIQNKIVLQDIPDFVNFLFNYIQEKQPKSLVNYIYKVAYQEFMFIEFKNFTATKQVQELEKTTQITVHECVICSSTYTGEKCPNCDFSYLDNNNLNKKEKALKIYNLPEKRKKEYFSELEEIHKKVFQEQQIDLKMLHLFTNDINKKYGII